MTKFQFGLFLLISCAVSSFCQSLQDLELEGYDNDVEMFNIGSNLPLLGRPKFKVTEHNDGWSVYLGYGNNRYIKFRYGDIPSIDFNILNHKGSFKIKDSEWLDISKDSFISIEGDVSEKHPCIWCFLDGNLKMKFQFMNGPDDPVIIDISFINNARIREYIWLPTAIIREIDNLDISLKIIIVPHNPVDSRADLKLNIRATEMRSDKAYSSEYIPGHYNLTSSLKLTQIDNSRRSEQPKFSAKLDIAEYKQFDATDILEPSFGSEQTFRAMRDNFHRSFNLDGMINFTNRGKRLAVMKLTDAETDRMVGRIQARFSDQDHLRVELFYDGEQMGAITWHKSENSSEVNLESSIYRCPDGGYQYSSNEYDSFNRTDDYYSNDKSSTYLINENSTVEEARTNLRNGNHTDEEYNMDDEYENNHTEGEYYQHLDEALGWTVEDENEAENCNFVRLWDTTFNEEQVTTRIYKDVVFSAYNRNYRKQQKERRVLFEENILMKNDGYKYDVTAFESYSGNTPSFYTISGDVRNSGEKTNITLSGPMVSLDLQINKNDTDRYKAKLEFGYEKIFDGWFYDFLGYSKNMDDKLIRSYLKNYFEISKAKEWYSYIYTIGQLIDI